jgi:hypothetical protein
MWSSGQSSWLQIQRFRVLFPALPDFLRSSGSGLGPTQPREDNWGATWKESSGSGLENRKINGRGDSLPWSRDTLYPINLALTSLTSGGRSVGIVSWRTKPRSFFNGHPAKSVEWPRHPSATLNWDMNYCNCKWRALILWGGLYSSGCLHIRGRKSS